MAFVLTNSELDAIEAELEQLATALETTQKDRQDAVQSRVDQLLELIATSANTARRREAGLRLVG